MRRLRLALLIIVVSLWAPVCGVAPLPTQWSEVVETSSACDERLWQHTWFAEQRLTTVATCATIEGVVRETHLSDDGDLIIEVQVDPRAVNDSNRNAWLKVEAVCQGHGTQEKHWTACRGYPGPKFRMPRVGTTVRVTGRYVVDRSHGGHMEIHPLSVLEVIG